MLQVVTARQTSLIAFLNDKLKKLAKLRPIVALEISREKAFRNESFVHIKVSIVLSEINLANIKIQVDSDSI